MKKTLNFFRHATMLVAMACAMLMTLMPQHANATALTDYAENKVVDALLRGQALSAPSNWFIGLDNVVCGDAAATGTEVSGSNYSRVTVTASLTAWAGTQSAGSTSASSGSNGTTSNNAIVSFPTPSATWGTVVSVRWWDAASGGNAWICTPLTTSKVINSGDTVTFPASSLTFQVDN